MNLRPWAAAVALLLGSVGLVACSDDGDTTTTDDAAPSTTIPDEERPPTSFAALQEIFDPMVEEYGVVLTRGALVDTSDGGYEISEDGNHLALYVEPTDEDAWDDETYVETFYALAADVSPYVFERWSELDTYDICQEPPNSVDDSPEPFPATQVQLPRSVAESFDWADGDLADLIVEDLRSDEVRIILGNDLREAEGIVAAQEEARQRLAAERDASSTTSG